MERQTSNLEILEYLKEYFSREDTKDLRFFQGLASLNLVKHVPVVNALGEKLYSLVEDNFNEESIKTLANLKQSIIDEQDIEELNQNTRQDNTAQ
jgi:hypothetical protein